MSHRQEHSVHRLVCAAFSTFAATMSAAMAQGVELVSVDAGGGPADGASTSRALSGDGRWFAFTSSSSDLVAGDGNGVSDVFVRDRWSGVTTRVSVDSSGGDGNGASSAPAISGDGRYVAFVSAANNLVAGDANGKQDIFLRDLQAGVTTLVSVATSGAQGDGDSSGPWLDWDGDVVAFASAATNFAAGDKNKAQDIFVRDLGAGTTTRVSVSSSGGEANGRSMRASLDRSGMLVCFSSAADNLVAGDGNVRTDCFVHDRATAGTIRISVNDAGFGGTDDSGDPEISGDGTKVVFDSASTNLVAGDTNGKSDIFLRDLVAGTTSRISVDAQGVQADGDSVEASLSDDGRIICFASRATNLVPQDGNGAKDVFVVQLDRQMVTRVSCQADGSDGDGNSGNPELSNDGYVVTFESVATNLVPGDTNGLTDVFSHATPEVRALGYGNGVAGSGGITPKLTAIGGRADGDDGYSVTISDAVGFSSGLLLICGAPADVPFAGGRLYVDPGLVLIPLPVLLGGVPGFPGAGSLTIDGEDVTALAGVSAYLQTLLLDPAAPKGISISNALEMDIVAR